MEPTNPFFRFSYFFAACPSLGTGPVTSQKPLYWFIWPTFSSRVISFNTESTFRSMGSLSFPAKLLCLELLHPMAKTKAAATPYRIVVYFILAVSKFYKKPIIKKASLASLLN
ncbi:hypothetical protein D3C86_1129620 [compost metagenome]